MEGQPAFIEREREDEKRRILDFRLSGDPGKDAREFLEASGHGYHRALMERGMGPEAVLEDLRDTVSRAVAREAARRPLSPHELYYRDEYFCGQELPRAHIVTIERILAERRSAPARQGGQKPRTAEAPRREGGTLPEVSKERSEVREDSAKVRRAALAARELEAAVDALNPARTPFRSTLEKTRRRLEEGVVMDEIGMQWKMRLEKLAHAVAKREKRL